MNLQKGAIPDLGAETRLAVHFLKRHSPANTLWRYAPREEWAAEIEDNRLIFNAVYSYSLRKTSFFDFFAPRG